MPKPNRAEQSGLGKIEFARPGHRVAEGRSDGGSVTGDAGMMLLGEIDRRLGPTQAASRCIADPRRAPLIKHAMRDVLRQRVPNATARCAAMWPCKRPSAWIARRPAYPRCAGCVQAG